MEYKKYPERTPLNIVSIPFIYMMIVPSVILHIFLEIYHTVCFPLYGIPYLKTRDYIKIDRHRLKYLNPVEKLNCMYCGYVNGLFHYASMVAAMTEHYWCGIKHEKKKGFQPPEHHKDYPEFGDKEAFRRKYVNKS
ncbi:hypothetical protein H6758_01635 [Candidatus Nomurabacteria bacterium]|nr:hypothetical protein [Candidatus Nomurabacteria bacterium]